MINWAQACAGAVIGLVLGSLLADPLKRVWSTSVHLLVDRTARRLGARWQTKWWYTDATGRSVETEDAITLRQFGVLLTGHNEGTGKWRYNVSGRLTDDIYFTGTWKTTRPGETYHGTFQLVVAANGDSMKGKWLGLSTNAGVRNGEWEWERLR